MSTPAQIRAERKTALRAVKKSLRSLDSKQEALERRINQILKIKKDFPDLDHAQYIMQELKVIDGILDEAIAGASNFSRMVQSF